MSAVAQELSETNLRLTIINACYQLRERDDRNFINGVYFISFIIINQKLHLQHNCCYTHKASIIT